MVIFVIAWSKYTRMVVAIAMRHVSLVAERLGVLVIVHIVELIGEASVSIVQLFFFVNLRRRSWLLLEVEAQILSVNVMPILTITGCLVRGVDHLLFWLEAFRIFLN